MTIFDERPSDELSGEKASRVVSNAFNTWKGRAKPKAGRDPRLPASSWWTEKDFQSARDRELPRILRSNASLMAPKMGEPTSHS